MDWPESSLGFLHNLLQKNPNKLYGQYILTLSTDGRYI